MRHPRRVVYVGASDNEVGAMRGKMISNQVLNRIIKAIDRIVREANPGYEFVVTDKEHFAKILAQEYPDLVQAFSGSPDETTL